ncbi:hypothetical protein NV379_02435 [Paenibacillus sp. N1-5-1-14]|uniref:hypothetical protein n=1 Tax=Paenibacillus radicibacter TaxID=2972488 RepID=UPI0021593903|nr:hypothetical protein [Paenibacillus radicibacter]MCR8641505.1 hypothetical protein [Paenibacillus radicibacter]
MAFHGTLAGNDIILSGAIEPTTKENSVYGVREEDNLNLMTSAGYIYLALEFEKAYEFALASMLQKRRTFLESTIYIFETETKGMEFYPDYDELGRYEESLRVAISETKTYAVKDKLLIGTRVNRYKKILVKNYKEACELLDSGKVNDYPWEILKNSE